MMNIIMHLKILMDGIGLWAAASVSTQSQFAIDKDPVGAIDALGENLHPVYAPSACLPCVWALSAEKF